MGAFAFLFIGSQPDPERGRGSPECNGQKLPPDFWLIFLLVAAAFGILAANWLGLLD